MANIELRNISIGYANKVVADGLTATLQSGTLTCLIGRNGAGKSTLLRTMMGRQMCTQDSKGIIALDGSDIAKMPARERAKRISVVLTEKPDVENMTVREMVAMGRSPYTGFWGQLSQDDEDIVERSLRLIGMESFAGRMVQTLSDGERQKVMIAKALAQQTPFIFLDEPTAFLDYPSKVETMTMLQRLCHEEHKAVLISTHDLDVALRHCDNVWLMTDGRLLCGSPTELREEIADFMRIERK